MSKKSSLNDMKSFLLAVQSNEGLLGFEVFSGLVDHGIFADRLPPCFISKGLSDKIPQDMIDLVYDDEKEKKKINKYRRNYIQYQSLRDVNIPRDIGIPHPEAYIAQALSIKRYWNEILEHCNRPSPTFRRVYVRRLRSGAVFEMNYKGVERFESEENKILWEASALYIVKADIKACFPSVYTHSIPWALHGKQKAKGNRRLGGLYGNLIDKCTQNTKDGQTNGILIGPHTSNIISEIVLTSVDLELQKKGYSQVVRYIDDYTFYAKSHQEAEGFIRDLNLLLRDFEMTLNEGKTKIIKTPAPSDADWVQALKRYQQFPSDNISFSVVRSYLDFVLELSEVNKKSTPINYAIKVLYGVEEALPLNQRAKRLYVQTAINLSLAYPYLAPLLGTYVFERYWFDGIEERISSFILSLIEVGIRKIYPDAISHAIYYALRYNIFIDLDEGVVGQIVEVDDCVTNVLLYKYGVRRSVKKYVDPIRKRVEEIKNLDKEEGDRFWLLIYHLWTESELRGNEQAFLADLKKDDFRFLDLEVYEPEVDKLLEPESADD